MPPFQPQRSPSPSFHADNLVKCLSDHVFRSPNVVPSCNPMRRTFWGPCLAVISSWGNVFAFSSRPTTFPGTWQALGQHLASAWQALGKRFVSARTAAHLCLVAGLIDRHINYLKTLTIQ
eukprot:12646395-Heterocapsa_arctica.AAC.1